MPRRYRTHRHPRRKLKLTRARFTSAYFLDGPEAGLRLRLTRDPILLRIAHNGGQVAALDQLGMEPEETDILFVYHRITPRPKHGSIRATYKFHLPQPPDSRARHSYGWPCWVKEQLAKK